jgi:hypothetical protein
VTRAGEDGQVAVLLVGVLLALVLGVTVLGGVAQALGGRAERQQAADLAALAGARALREVQPRLWEPATLGGRPNPRRLTLAAYRGIGLGAAQATAARNGLAGADVELVDGEGAPPVRVRVRDARPVRIGGVAVPLRVLAEAELVPDAGSLAPVLTGNPGEYPGPFAMRQGKPMRPDVAQAFDRMAAAARGAGLTLLVTSAFRSDAEQAVLFARNPDPKWVAPPGKSLHRLGTELDLGPPGAHGWLAANAQRFGFLKRYSWEDWHFGFVGNPGSRSVGWLRGGRTRGQAGRASAAPTADADGERSRVTGSTLPDWVPDAYAATIARAAMRWNVSGALLAAQLRQESNFNPRARSGAGALGIAQFMPATAAAYGLRDPFDPVAAIDAQAHLMHDLLRQFAAVPLALAAYNAGPVPVRACGCVPSFPETVAYVAAILGLAGGAGDMLGTTLAVRLVR